MQQTRCTSGVPHVWRFVKCSLLNVSSLDAVFMKVDRIVDVGF